MVEYRICKLGMSKLAEYRICKLGMSVLVEYRIFAGIHLMLVEILFHIPDEIDVIYRNILYSTKKDIQH